MTNYEFYKDRFIDMISDFAGIKGGNVCKCVDIGCAECELKKEERLTGCSNAVRKWLLAEHIEKLILPAKVYHFLMAIKDTHSYIVRTHDGSTLLCGQNKTLPHDGFCINGFLGIDIPFIGADETWDIADLLKLEVGGE